MGVIKLKLVINICLINLSLVSINPVCSCKTANNNTKGNKGNESSKVSEEVDKKKLKKKTIPKDIETEVNKVKEVKKEVNNDDGDKNAWFNKSLKINKLSLKCIDKEIIQCDGGVGELYNEVIKNDISYILDECNEDDIESNCLLFWFYFNNDVDKSFNLFILSRTYFNKLHDEDKKYSRPLGNTGLYILAKYEDFYDKYNVEPDIENVGQFNIIEIK